MSTQKGHIYLADKSVVVRTPLLPLTLILEWRKADDPEAYLSTLLERPDIREAIFIASPGLHDAISQWREDYTKYKSAGIALAKYVARMAGRATPFGLCAGLSVGTVGRCTSIELGPRTSYVRRTRLDNDYLSLLAERLSQDPHLKERLTYRVNSSSYRLGGQIRYASTDFVGGDRRYELNSIEMTSYIDTVLHAAAPGASFLQLKQSLISDDVTDDEATGFVDDLIQSQLLVPTFGLMVTGRDPIDGLLDGLQEAQHFGHQILDGVRSALRDIDERGLGNEPRRYHDIVAVLQDLKPGTEVSRLVQVDMLKPATISIDQRVASETLRAICQLGRISRTSEAEGLGTFRAAFRARWEDQEVPLAEVLDEDVGIGFEIENEPTATSPLLHGLDFPLKGAANSAAWRPFHTFMLRRLAVALAAGEQEIVLTDDDFDQMELPDPPRTPDSFAARLRLAGVPDREKQQDLRILYEGPVGPPGAKMLGRFCYLSPEVDTMVRDHLRVEEACEPDAIFAEIVHLNDGRVGNIVCRPVLRDHEIAYLGMSGAPRERQIRLDDLFVSVRGNRIVLRSRTLRREILPRLTTAHNFRYRGLGAYRFLCALAAQGTTLGIFSWGPLSTSPFLPRVRYGRVLFSRRTWNLDHDDLQEVTAAARAYDKSRSGELIAQAVASLRSKLRLPRFVAIADGDNELPIDFENRLLVHAFADEVSGAAQVTVYEMFPDPDNLLAVGPDGLYAQELVLLYSRSPVESIRVDDAVRSKEVIRGLHFVKSRREFPPGSEWLYAKMYCGESQADRIICRVADDVIRPAQEHGDVDQWFFIRYADPDFHVRIRVHGDPTSLCARVLPQIQRVATALAAERALLKITVDTYVREIERYGGDGGIELVEQLFWHDSEATVRILKWLSAEGTSDARWRLAMRGMDTLLTVLGLGADERERLASQGKEMLGREFGATTHLWSQIGKLYRSEREDLNAVILRDANLGTDHNLAAGFQCLAARDTAMEPVAAELRRRELAGALSPSISSFALSLTHMHVNRMIPTSPRAHELVLYDLIRRSHAARRSIRTEPTTRGRP